MSWRIVRLSYGRIRVSIILLLLFQLLLQRLWLGVLLRCWCIEKRNGASIETIYK